MTREQIEKTAMLSCASKDEVLTDFGSNCFIEGAQWRINSVWHNGKFRPEHGKYVLLQLKGNNFKIDMWNDCEYIYLEHYSYSSIERWAYVDDLLP